MSRVLALANMLAALALFLVICATLDSDAIEYASRYVFWALAAGSAFAGAVGAQCARILIRD